MGLATLAEFLYVEGLRNTPVPKHHPSNIESTFSETGRDIVIAEKINAFEMERVRAIIKVGSVVFGSRLVKSESFTTPLSQKDACRIPGCSNIGNHRGMCE